MYSYTISKEPNNALFLRICAQIEKHISGSTKDELLIDVDGCCSQTYHFSQGKIKVCNDYEVYALYVDSDIDLSDILKEYMVMGETTINKLVYKHERFDVTQLKIGARTIIYTITPDGKLVVREYRGSRKVHSQKVCHFSLEEYNALCKNIEACIESADRLDFYVDDSSEELKIYHLYGRIQTVDRGLGSKNNHIGGVMWDFLKDKV